MSERLKVEEGPRAKQHRCLQKLEKAGRDESLRSLRKEPALPTHFQTSDLQTVKEYIICVALSSSTSGNVSQQPLETVARRGSLGQEGLAGEQSSHWRLSPGGGVWARRALLASRAAQGWQKRI